MFKFFRKAKAETSELRTSEPTANADAPPARQITVRAKTEAKGGGTPTATKPATTKRSKTPSTADTASDERLIELQQTLPMRARPQVLYRMALVPTRRSSWDDSFVESGWLDEGQSLRDGARARFKLNRRLGGLRFEAEMQNLKTSKRGGWRSVGPVGPLEFLEQHWKFEQVQGQRGQGGGAVVTLTVRGAVRYKWVRPQVERLLHNMLLGTLVGMQREVDAPAARRVEEMGKKLKAEEDERKKSRKKFGRKQFGRKQK